MNFFDCYQRAGKIASVVRERARKKYHVGSTLFRICESIEAEIRDLGGAPAFPVNVSLNDIAAHYTAEPNDTLEVKGSDILKIDIGVQIDGYIADTAVTVCYDPKSEALVKVAEMALNEAVKVAKVDAKANDIGAAVENTIVKQGFKPIQNLSGHSLERYTIHAGRSIPNIRTIGPSFRLSSNQAYAVEPFVTTKDGQGVVYEGRIRNIFSITSRKPSKNQDADIFLAQLWNKFRTLPFAIRWITDLYEEQRARQLIELLVKKKNVHAYPILVEGNGKTVSQAEHTLIPGTRSNYVITL
ncbi:MAG TPA: type II methionyl aminopeptidase [Candidatus Bathyarchaeia archaeon]|jgi:methionyl aminopeptidase|nr:type II methionyl aminopeptidase [Candidatus Bathyarchaeia archaeon]